MLGIPIILHGGNDRSKHLGRVNLKIEIKKTEPYVFSVFNKNGRSLVDIPSFVYDEHVFIGITICIKKCLYPVVVFLNGFFPNAGAITFLNTVQKTTGLCFIQTRKLLAKLVFFGNPV